MNHFWHILFLGIALFQLLFMLAQWLLFGRKEYIFYITYIFFAAVYILFRLHAATNLFSVSIHPWILEWLDQPMAILSYYMYLLFTRHFLSLKHLQPEVYRYSRYIELIFVVFLIAKTLSIPFGIPASISAYTYMAAVVLMVTLVIPMVVLMLRQRNILNNFLVMGSICYIGGGVIGMIVAMFQPVLGTSSTMILLGLEIGILAELLLLNTGFLLKNRILQQQVIQGQQKLLDQLLSDKKGPFVE